MRQTFCLITHLHHQRDFSLRTFGPGHRTAGVTDHISKELIEIAQSPTDLMEWVDVILLALDGAWRAGHEPEQIADAISAKFSRNLARTWPDWRTMPADKAIEHVRKTWITEFGEEDDSYNIDTSGNPGIALFANSLHLWAMAQGHEVSVATAAATFNVSPELILDAITWHRYMTYSGPEHDYSRCMIDHDGE